MKSIKEKAQEWADMYPSCGMADKSKEKILEDIQSLIQDIDKCENELLRSKSEGDTKMFLKTLYEIERLLVAAHQELSFLYDYIEEGGKDEYTD